MKDCKTNDTQNMKVNVLLFAAGLGTRLRPATDKHPKPVIPLLGVPMGYYCLPYLESLNVEKFVVNTFHLPDQVRNCYKAISEQIVYSNETDFIKGSGGGLKHAEKLFDLNYPILTANADEVFFTPDFNFLSSAYTQHINSSALATLIVTENEHVGSKFGGIWTDVDLNVVGIGKEKPIDAVKGWHFVGMQILSPKILDSISLNKELNIFYDVLINHIKKETIKVLPVKMDWYETGNLQDYLTAKKEIAEKIKMNSFYQEQFKKLGSYARSNLSDLS